jgi:hypothetical protein
MPDPDQPYTPSDDEEIARILGENGATGIGEGIHSWRCEYPDRYGACDCADRLVNDLTDLIASVRRDTQADALIHVADLLAIPGTISTDSGRVYINHDPTGMGKIPSLDDWLRTAAAAIRRTSEDQEN